MIADAAALSELIYAPPPVLTTCTRGGECSDAITLCVRMNRFSTWRLQILYWGDFLLSVIAGCIKPVHSRPFFDVCNLPHWFSRPWKVMESHGPTTGQRRANYRPFACVKLWRTGNKERARAQLMFGLHVQLWLCRCLDCELRLPPTTSVSGKQFNKYAWNNPRLWTLWTSSDAPLALPPPRNSWSLKMS